MAGISIISEPIRTMWFPVDYNTVTLYEGQLVTWSFSDSKQGIIAYTVAGVEDTTSDHVPLGVVVGFNNRTPTFDTTYKGNYGTSVSTQEAQLARSSCMVEGKMWRNDPALMAQVALVDPSSILKARIFYGSYGTACQVVTNTTQSTNGSTITTASLNDTPPAYNQMWYCRSGKNMGLYRAAYSAHKTSHTFYLTWPYDIEVGDTFTYTAFSLGNTKALFHSTGTYLEQQGGDHDTTYTTNWLYLDIFEINLAEAGNEYAIFRLNASNFVPVART